MVHVIARQPKKRSMLLYLNRYLEWKEVYLWFMIYDQMLMGKQQASLASALPLSGAVFKKYL